MDDVDIDLAVAQLVRMAKEYAPSFFEEEKEKAICEAKTFLAKYDLKPQKYGECKCNNNMTKSEGVYHIGDWQESNFIFVKVFRGKLYCWFDAIDVMRAICRDEIHILTDEELEMVLYFANSLFNWMKWVEENYYFCPASISRIKNKIKGLFYMPSGRKRKNISSATITTMLYEMLIFKSKNKQYGN